MTRVCPIDGCTRPIEHDWIMCPQHWFQLPSRVAAHIRRVIGEARGQDTLAVRAACRTAIDWHNRRRRGRRRRKMFVRSGRGTALRFPHFPVPR